MQYPTDLYSQSPADVAPAINSQIRQLVATFKAWRASVAGLSVIASGDARENYQLVVALRRNILSYIALPGLEAVVKSRYSPDDATFVLATAMNDVVAACTSYLTWFQTNWPHAANGAPTFDAYDATTFELVPYPPVTLTTPQQTVVLSRIDGLINAFK